MKTPWYQNIIKQIGFILIRVVLVGQLFDAIANANALITMPIAFILTIIILITWGGIELYLRHNPILWKFKGNKNLLPLKKLNSKFRLPIFGAILLLWIPIIFQLNSPPVKKGTPVKKGLFKPDEKTFNLLLLPLNPDNNCVIQDRDYERQILEKYKVISQKDSLNISIKKLNENKCIVSDSEAKDIGTFHNADLIIWGYYDETCEGPIKVRLKYYLLNFKNYYLEGIPRQWDSEMQRINELYDLQKGELTKDIDDIIFTIAGISKFKTKDFSQALEYFKSIPKEKRRSKLITLIGFCYREIGDLDHAIEKFTEYINLAPDNYLGYLHRAHTYREKYRKESIYIDYDSSKIVNNSILKNVKIDLLKAYQLKQNDEYMLLDISDIYLQFYQLDSAIIYINKALKHFPKSWYAHYKKAQFLEEKLIDKERKDTGKMEIDMQTVVGSYQESMKYSSQEDKPYIFYKLSHFSMRFNDNYDLAQEYIDKAIKLAPNTYYLYSQRARLCHRSNYYSSKKQKIESCIKDYSKAIELGKDKEFLILDRARAYEDIGQLNKAIKDYKEALVLAKSNQKEFIEIEILRYLSQAEKKIGKNEDAFNNISDAISKIEKVGLEVKYYYYYEERSEIAKKIGDLESAKKDSIKIKLLEIESGKRL